MWSCRGVAVHGYRSWRTDLYRKVRTEAVLVVVGGWDHINRGLDQLTERRHRIGPLLESGFGRLPVTAPAEKSESSGMELCVLNPLNSVAAVVAVKTEYYHRPYWDRRFSLHGNCNPLLRNVSSNPCLHDHWTGQRTEGVLPCWSAGILPITALITLHVHGPT